MWSHQVYLPRFGYTQQKARRNGFSPYSNERRKRTTAISSHQPTNQPSARPPCSAFRPWKCHTFKYAEVDRNLYSSPIDLKQKRRLSLPQRTKRRRFFITTFGCRAFIYDYISDLLSFHSGYPVHLTSTVLPCPACMLDVSLDARHSAVTLAPATISPPGPIRMKTISSFASQQSGPHQTGDGTVYASMMGMHLMLLLL